MVHSLWPRSTHVQAPGCAAVCSLFYQLLQSPGTSICQKKPTVLSLPEYSKVVILPEGSEGDIFIIVQNGDISHLNSRWSSNRPENLPISWVGKAQPSTCKIFNVGEHRLCENKREEMVWGNCITLQ